MRKKLFCLLAVSILVLCVFCGCQKTAQIDERDFEFFITMEKESFIQGEDIKVNISLKNKSAYDLKIYYYFLIMPDIPTGNFPVATELPSETYEKEFNSGEIYQKTEEISNYLESGQHEIKYRTSFYLNYGKEDETYISISSNVIKIIIDSEG